MRKTIPYRILLAINIFFACASIAYAKPVEFIGLNWSMTIDEMLSELKTDQYDCKNENDDKNYFYSCMKKDAIISITPKRILYTCGSFNGCGYSFEEVTRKFSENYGLQFDYKSAAEDAMEGENYSARGELGEKIVIVSHDMSGKVAVIIYRDKFGDGGMKF